MNHSEKPIRVLQVFASLNMGGAESRMMDVFRNINREEYDFTFLCMSQGHQYYEDEIRSLGGTVIKIHPPREDGIFRHFQHLWRVIKSGNYQVVHAHTSFHCGIAMLGAWLCGVPVRIAHSRTTGSKNASLKNKVALRVGRLFVSMFSTIRLAISPESGRYLFGKKQFTVMPNAINCEKYLHTPKEIADSLKKQYGIERSSICLGFVGRFDSMKNHAFALEVFQQYAQDHIDARLIFVGDGALRKRIEEKVATLELDGKVIFTGIQANVNEWMRVIDVLLVPSFFEGLGGVILEAQAAGTPVIKSDSFTNEADMGLGLVQAVPIDCGVAPWLDEIERAKEMIAPTDDTIRNAFARRGYSLSGEIESLGKIYQGVNR